MAFQNPYYQTGEQNVYGGNPTGQTADDFYGGTPTPTQSGGSTTAGGGVSDAWDPNETYYQSEDGWVTGAEMTAAGGQPGMGYSSGTGGSSLISGGVPYAPGGGGAGGGGGGSFSDSGGAQGPGAPAPSGFPPMGETTISSYPPGGAAPMATSIPYTEGQEQFQQPYLDMLSGMMGQPNFGYNAPDLTALLGGQAGQSPEEAVKAIYGAMEGDINRQRSKGMELIENRGIMSGRSPTSGTGIAGQANFLQDFNTKAAANLAGNRLNVGQFGLQAGGMRNDYMQNMLGHFQEAGYGGRSKTQSKNPYVDIGQ